MTFFFHHTTLPSLSSSHLLGFVHFTAQWKTSTLTLAFTTSAPCIVTLPPSSLSLSFTNVFFLGSAEFHCSSLLSKAYLCLSSFPSTCSVSTNHVLFRYSPQRVWARPSTCPLLLPRGEPRLSNVRHFPCKIWPQATLTVYSLGNSSVWFDLDAECLSVPFFRAYLSIRFKVIFAMLTLACCLTELLLC